MKNQESRLHRVTEKPEVSLQLDPYVIIRNTTDKDCIDYIIYHIPHASFVG